MSAELDEAKDKFIAQVQESLEEIWQRVEELALEGLADSPRLREFRDVINSEIEFLGDERRALEHRELVLRVIQTARKAGA